MFCSLEICCYGHKYFLKKMFLRFFVLIRMQHTWVWVFQQGNELFRENTIFNTKSQTRKKTLTNGFFIYLFIYFLGFVHKTSHYCLFRTPLNTHTMLSSTINEPILRQFSFCLRRNSFDSGHRRTRWEFWCF